MTTQRIAPLYEKKVGADSLIPERQAFRTQLSGRQLSPKRPERTGVFGELQMHAPVRWEIA